MTIISLFLSCMEMENHLVLKADGSGTLTINYRFSEEFAQLSEGNFKDLPFPIRELDFNMRCDSSSGLALKEHRIRREKGDIVVKAVVRFSALEDLNALFGDGKSPFSREGRELTIVIPAGGGDIGADSLIMAEELLAGRNFSYRIELPGEILYTSEGAPEKKGKFSYTISLVDVLKLNEEKHILLKW